MSRPVVLLWVLGLCLLAPALSGCDSGGFVPPPPPELSAPALSGMEPAARVVELVLASNATPDRGAWAQVVRLEAGDARTGFRFAALGPNDPPQGQAELIREAAARGVSVLIVEPAQAPEVADALEQARKQGTPSVLLDRPLDAPGNPFPVVLPAPCADSARQLVEAAVADAKTAGLPADGKALVLVPSPPEAHTNEARDALRAALQAAGVSQVETVEYPGAIEGAQKAITARLQADPSVTLVLTTSADGFTGTTQAREELLKSGRLVIMAGYGEITPHSVDAYFDTSAAVADLNLVKVGRQAFQVALRLAQGESVPDRTEVPTTVRRYSSKTPGRSDAPGSK